jgi:hypothetical protein
MGSATAFVLSASFLQASDLLDDSYLHVQFGLGIKTKADSRPALATDGFEGTRRGLVGPGAAQTDTKRTGTGEREEKGERADKIAAGKRGSGSSGRSSNPENPRRFAPRGMHTARACLAHTVRKMSHNYMQHKLTATISPQTTESRFLQTLQR